MPFSESCELLLAAACLVAALVAQQDRHYWRVLGFLLVTMTALVGTRLIGEGEALRVAGRILPGVAGRLGLLLIAIGGVQGAMRHLVVLGLANLMVWLPEPWVLAGNLIALGIIALPGRSQSWVLAVSGSLLVAVAGMAIGTQGQWRGAMRLDLYHLTLMLAALCWILAQLGGTRWAWRPSPILGA